MRRSSLWLVVSPRHRWSACLGAILLTCVTFMLVTSAQAGWPRWGHVGLSTFVLVGAYLVAMEVMRRLETSVPPVDLDQTSLSDPSAALRGAKTGMPLRQALVGYGWSSAVVVAMGIWLPQFGLQLAEAMGWSHGFVGAVFIAVATSLPEVATTWGAVRLGALDLVLANLLGSNLFDVLILAIDDLAYLPGPLFAAVAPSHAWTAGIAASMSGMVFLALRSKPHPAGREGRKVWAVALVACYALSALWQFHAAP